MSFWNSKLVKDLENGKLPQVPVVIEPASVIILMTSLLIVGLILILTYRIFKRI